MINRNTLCMGCMKDKGDANVCPFCGYLNDSPQQPPYLAGGTTLAGRYILGKILRTNGESAVYLGFDSETKRIIEVKEFFPKSFCSRGSDGLTVGVSRGEELVYREYLNSFLEIARAVARLRNLSGIVDTYDIFELNNTAYVVSARLEGVSLRSYIRKKGAMPYEAASKAFLPIISTMISAHTIGVHHFGICPDTIILTRDGKAKIIDFGIPEAHLSDTEIEAQLFEGYSAVEQYSLDGKKGDWTDVYGICASLFFTITAKDPPGAINRSYDPSLTIPKELVRTIPVHAVTALAGGLQVVPEKRISSLESLKKSLTVGDSQKEDDLTVGVTAPPVSERENSSQPRSVSKVTPIDERSEGFWDKFSGMFNLDDNRKENLKYGIISCGIAFVVLGLIAWAVFAIFFGDMINDDPDTDTQVTVSSTTESLEPTESNVSSLYSDEVVLYQVPNLKGKSFEAAIETYSMFDIIKIEEQYSDSEDEGIIISQNVEAEIECAGGTPIGVVVSKGPENVKLPKIIGKTVSDADELLTNVGLNIGEQTEEYSDDVEAGKIISIKGGYKEGSKVPNGSYINIVVSKGEEPSA